MTTRNDAMGWPFHDSCLFMQAQALEVCDISSYKRMIT
jgi:hypothetical protein